MRKYICISFICITSLYSCINLGDIQDQFKHIPNTLEVQDSISGNPKSIKFSLEPLVAKPKITSDQKPFLGKYLVENPHVERVAPEYIEASPVQGQHVKLRSQKTTIKHKELSWPERQNTKFNYQPFGLYPFFYLDIEEGMRDSWITRIIEDKFGKIWISTWSGGLSVWDGKSITHITEQHGLSSNRVGGLIEDGSGNIWIGTDYGVDIWNGVELLRYENPGLELNNVGAMLEDRNGKIWVGTWGGGVKIFPNLHSENFMLLTKEEGLSNNRVQDLLEDSNGNIWIATQQSLNIWDGKSLARFGTTEGLPDDDILSLLEDRNGNIWIGTANGLCVWDGDGLQTYTNENGLIGNYIWDLVEDHLGNIWVATTNGLSELQFDENNNFANVKSFSEKEGLSHSMTLRLFVDRYNKLWIGTQNGGVNVLEDENILFFSDKNGLKHSIVHSLAEDDEGNIWIGMLEGKVAQWKDKSFTYFQSPNQVHYNQILSILEDRKRHIWMGSSINGLTKWDRQQLTNWAFSDNNSFFTVLNILESRDGTIWIVTEIGIILYRNNQFLSFKFNKELGSGLVTSLLEDEDGKVWIGTENGVSVWTGQNKDTLLKFLESDNLENRIKVSTLERGMNGSIWIGTQKGLFRWTQEGKWPNGYFLHYQSHEKGLKEPITALESDKDGNVYALTPHKVLKLNTLKNPITIQSFGLEDGIKGKKFEKMLLDNNNRLWVGGSGGLNQILTNKLEQDSTRPIIYISSLNSAIGNIDWRKVKANELKKETLSPYHFPEHNLTYVSFDLVKPFTNLPMNIVFASNTKNLSINWTGHSRNSDKIRYTYYLEGIDREWSPLVEANQQEFRNLRHGDYVFKLRALGSNGKWSDTQTFSFTILPPWYQTIWAYILYSLIIIVIFYALYLYQRRRWQLQSQLQLEQEKATRLKELDNFKSRFYTNITHEFRTPLTVIKGMASQIKEDQNIKALIQRNSHRLLNMVNQLLDLSKLESNSLTIDWIQGDIISYLKYLTESCHSLAGSKHINLAFFSTQERLVMDYDENKLQQILINLLSNAIKFTPEYGSVKVIANQTNDEYVELTVSDTGKGIPADKLPHIFNRFYQIDDSSTRKSEGSGIGLALVKELVGLLEGKIEVISEVNKGSEFKVYLPIQQKIEVTAKVIESMPISGEMNNVTAPVLVSTQEKSEDKPLVLVIEDNADVAEYIFFCLKEDYALKAAQHGKEGVDKALEIIPDVILCDVMMPEMDGFEVCERLKSDKLTSHIPIVLLTAKATQEDKVTGLSYGADAYLTKPFDKEELLARLKNLSLVSKRLQERLANTDTTSKKADPLAEKEAVFLQEVNDIIHSNINNELFNTEWLCREIAMSRTQLHRKLKALTNQSTASYIRSVRLQKAKSLLETTDVPIGEIAFMVGFKDFSHFSRMFLKEFGIQPSKVR